MFCIYALLTSPKCLRQCVKIIQYDKIKKKKVGYQREIKMGGGKNKMKPWEVGTESPHDLRNAFKYRFI